MSYSDFCRTLKTEVSGDRGGRFCVLFLSQFPGKNSLLPVKIPQAVLFNKNFNLFLGGKFLQLHPALDTPLWAN